VNLLNLFSRFSFILSDNLLLQKNAQSLCEKTVFLCVNLIDPKANQIKSNERKAKQSEPDLIEEIDVAVVAGEVDHDGARLLVDPLVGLEVGEVTLPL